MTVFQYVGNTAPSVPDTLEQTVNGVTTPINLTSGTVNFRLRSLFGSTLLIDSPATIVSAPAGTVQYDWTLANVTTDIASSPGPYRASWFITLAGQTVQTPEFDIEFLGSEVLRSVGPCTNWCGTQDVVACYSDTTDDSCLVSAVRMASEALYEMSGHVFGGWCQSTIRPCASSGCFPFPQILSRGHIVWGNDGWYYGDSGEPCQCGGWLSQVQMPGVAQTIVSVSINGVTLLPTAYRLDPNNRLVRTDGGTWPICQNLAASNTGQGSFTIVYSHSYQPPELGRRAAAQLAHEFWMACQNQDCSLPTGVVEVVRQGIAVKINPNLWGAGATGLNIVDSFISAYGQKPGFAIMSPEVNPTARRVT